MSAFLHDGWVNTLVGMVSGVLIGGRVALLINAMMVTVKEEIRKPLRR